MAPPSKYSPEFREEAVQLVLVSNRPVAHVARELGINHETLRTWVRQHQREQGEQPESLATDERARLKELERRVRELETENSFLKKAAAYFARDPR